LTLDLTPGFALLLLAISTRRQVVADWQLIVEWGSQSQAANGR
jgi:hypothetical protein